MLGRENERRWELEKVLFKTWRFKKERNADHCVKNWWSDFVQIFSSFCLVSLFYLSLHSFLSLSLSRYSISPSRDRRGSMSCIVLLNYAFSKFQINSSFKPNDQHIHEFSNLIFIIIDPKSINRTFFQESLVRPKPCTYSKSLYSIKRFVLE